MRVIIDTSSLISLVRYYLPFDKDSHLFENILRRIENHDIIIIDEVLNECRYTSKGIVVKSMNYLENKGFQKEFKVPIRTKDVLPPAPAKFYRRLEHEFINASAKNNLSVVEFENRKSTFLKSADCRIVIHALNCIKLNPHEEIIIITEESEANNDNKAFKKLPTICKLLDIKVLTLPQLLEKYPDIDLRII